MPVPHALQTTALSLLLTGSVASCSIPGMRPEGRTANVSANAPAARADVYARARTWFARNQYTIERDVASAQLRGYSTIATEGEIETRAVVEFVITSSTGDNTSYRVSGHTERGRPPSLPRVDQNAPEAGSAVSSLVAYLQCPTAGWPRCP